MDPVLIVSLGAAGTMIFGSIVLLSYLKIRETRKTHS
jgi:hypothetical protein